MTWRPYFLSYVIFSSPASKQTPDRKYGAPINFSVFLGSFLSFQSYYYFTTFIINMTTPVRHIMHLPLCHMAFK